MSDDDDPCAPTCTLILAACELVLFYDRCRK